MDQNNEPNFGNTPPPEQPHPGGPADEPGAAPGSQPYFESPPPPGSYPPATPAGGAQVFQTPTSYPPAGPAFEPPPPQGPYAVPPPSKPRRTWLTVLIVILVLCCLCAAGTYIFYQYIGDWLLCQLNTTYCLPVQ